MYLQLSRDLGQSNPAAESSLFARDTCNQNKSRTKRNTSDKRRARSGKMERGGARGTFCGGKTFRLTSKQQQTGGGRGGRRLAQVRLSHQGNAREEKQRREGSGKVRERFGVVLLTRPWSARKKRRKKRRGRVGPRTSRTAPQPATTENNELTSRLVTSRENMAARGHASDH